MPGDSSIKERFRARIAFLGERIRTFKALFQIKDDIFVAALIFLVGIISFGLGRLSAMEKGRGPDSSAAVSAAIPPVPPANTDSVQAAPASAAPAASTSVVASKNGAKYYLPSCSGASRIKDENKVWFPSPAEARAAGFTPAANCPGLE